MPKMENTTIKNTAAWLTAAKVRPLQVGPSPVNTPGPGKILIHNRALGVNPIDGKLQFFALFPLDYPTILGQDISGVVEAVGEGVTDIKQGDRVMAKASGFESKIHEEMGFQRYTIADTITVVKLPTIMSFEEAATMPLALTTASSGLFNSDMLDLLPPSSPAREPIGKTVLIWGGSSCVGSNAIQLAVAAGYKVVTTASPKNFESVKKIGATHILDYRQSTIVADLLRVTQNETIAGVFDAIGIDGAWQHCVKFAELSDGNKFVATVYSFIKDLPDGITSKKVFAPSTLTNGVARYIWGDFLPKALAENQYRAFTGPLIVGKGLEYVQEAIDIERQGMSAQKAIVLLD